VAVDCTFLGAGGDAETLLRPFDKVDGRISDSRVMLPVAELGSITARAARPAHRPRQSGK
jgi:hypothetical protein